VFLGPVVELEALEAPAIVAKVAEGGLVVVATAAVVGVLAFDEVLVVGAVVVATVPLETTPQVVQFLT